MKKILKNYNFIASAIIILSFVSCNKSFLDVPAKGAVLTENYYANRDQAYNALVGVYDAIRKNTGGFENMVAMMNAGSDDNVAGGASSTDGSQIQAFNTFTLNAVNMPGSFWNDHYQGVFRANILLSKLSGVTMDATEKARFTAETKALRALYYFNLVRMFKNIPLIVSPLSAADIYTVKQAAPADVYTQIEKDLTEALPSLPPTITQSEWGRLTKGGTAALLGKVYLYDGKNALAAAQFADVNGTPGGTSIYGYKLLANYSDLWVTSNKFNSESIIECVHSNQAKLAIGACGVQA